MKRDRYETSADETGRSDGVPKKRDLAGHWDHDASGGAERNDPEFIGPEAQANEKATEVVSVRDSKGRFVKGKSGNPRGRPVGRHLWDELNDQLALTNADGVTNLTQIVETWLALAKSGSIAAIDSVVRRLAPEALLLKILTDTDSSVVDSILAARDRVQEQQVLDMQPTELFEQPVALGPGSTPSSEETDAAAPAESKLQSDSQYLEELVPTDPEAAEAARRARWSRRFEHGESSRPDGDEPRRRFDDYDAGLEALERHRQPARSKTARGM